MSMQENGKIESRQFMILVTLFSVGSFLLLPKFIVEEAKQDAWISVIVLVGLGLLLAWLYKTLGGLFPNMTLVEYSEKILGRWIGKITSFLFFTYSLILCAIFDKLVIFSHQHSCQKHRLNHFIFFFRYCHYGSTSWLGKHGSHFRNFFSLGMYSFYFDDNFSISTN